jgi:hypothetical protein
VASLESPLAIRTAGDRSRLDRLPVSRRRVGTNGVFVAVLGGAPTTRSLGTIARSGSWCDRRLVPPPSQGDQDVTIEQTLTSQERLADLDLPALRQLVGLVEYDAEADPFPVTGWDALVWSVGNATQSALF